MSFFAQRGTLIDFQVSLTNGTPSVANAFTPKSDEWVDVYTIVLSTNDTAVQTVSISDGTRTLKYYVGGSAVAFIAFDQGSVPIRFKKGTAISVSAGAVTAAKTIEVSIRGLASKT